MNEPKFVDWSKVKTGIKEGFFLFLFFLLSPLWVLGLIFKSLSSYILFLGNTILSPINFLIKTITTSLNDIIKNRTYSVSITLLHIARALLVIIKLAIQGLFYLLAFIIQIISFPFYLLYTLFSGQTYNMISESNDDESKRIQTSVGASASFSDKLLKVSIAYPKLLSKRFEGTFLFQIYSSKNRSAVSRAINVEFQNEIIVEQTFSSNIRIGQNIKVKLFSPQIDFSDAVIKVINKDVTKITFLGVPKDSCQPGFHKVLVSITDGETDKEFESMTIKVNVTDFAFDHISKPLLSQISSVVLGIGSIVMFTLTLLEQIDKTIGLTSGTASGVLAAIIYANLYNLYQRVRSITQ